MPFAKRRLNETSWSNEIVLIFILILMRTVKLRWFHSVALRILSVHHFLHHACLELYRFSMKAELLREINGRFLLNELGDPTFLFHLFKEKATLRDISKFEEFFIIQFSNIPIDSLLQSDFRRFTRNVQMLDLCIVSLLSFLWQL